MVWKCIMLHIFHCKIFATSTGIYSVKKCQKKILLIFYDTFEQVSIQFVKKKLILLRVTYKYVFAVRFMALCVFFSSHLGIISLSFSLDFTLLVCPLMNEKVLQSSLYVVWSL